MFEDYYMTADDVAKALKISKSFAYKVIRKMNAELQEQGFFTMAGKVNKHRLDLHLTDSGGRGKNLLTAALFMLHNRTVFSLNHREVACFSVDV